MVLTTAFFNYLSPTAPTNSMDLFGTGTYSRIGMTSATVAGGSYIDITCWIRAVGTHTSSNLVYMRVRDNSTDAIVHEASITAGSLTGGSVITQYTFTFSTCGIFDPSTQTFTIEYPYGDSANYLGFSSAGVSHYDLKRSWNGSSYDSTTSHTGFDAKLSNTVGHDCGGSAGSGTRLPPPPIVVHF